MREAWSAVIGVMLAEHDRGRPDRAIAMGRQGLAEIRAAGRLRQSANRLGMWLMMLAQSGETQATRLALPEAMQLLDRAGRRGMLLLPLAWLAWYEDRLQSATALLARFDSSGGTGREFAPGTYIRRSVDSLWGRLQLKCGAERLARARDAALDISDDQAVVAATGTAGDGGCIRVSQCPWQPSFMMRTMNQQLPAA